MKPSIPNPQELSRPAIKAEYFLPEALELIKRVRSKSELSDDETIMLALTAAQAALAKHVEPGNTTAHETLETILKLLDHDEVVQATLHKLHHLRRADAIGANVPKVY